ncbi:hypothetical protein HYH03_014231 [Edaphochlamys debaryana]|uniref:RRM domain-containing protein n=1 Tax=Edaphochlamys debaryana TaxID=47281 RepID=A0A835XQH4_9CHLO|nr:hypothetical protein HYH03_014231 [Edaphochlamys debaryana]|eukprot:KAG2487118.1 hypothetical protein HYH03_014231 [Edaphochlamys debaryana]
MFANAAAAAAAGYEQQLVSYGYPTAMPAGATVLTAATGAPAMSPTGEEIRTIFVTGFPANVHERELHNLVCFLPGYEASQMNAKPATGTSPQGFALFSSPAAAQAAMLLMHDMQFDTDCHLRCEMAHKNMYLKEDPSIRRADARRSGVVAGLVPAATGASGMLAAMAPHGAALNPAAMSGMGGMGHHAFAGPLLASTLAALRPAAHHHAGGLLPPPGQAAAMAAQHAGLINPIPVAGFGPVTNKFDNPPCNTLFIGNLGDTVDEGELTALFSCQPGYKQLKLLRHPRQVSCFVEFADVPSASAVHSALQGALLTSSDRGPIRIQYSKNPYGKRSPHAGMGLGMSHGIHGGPGSLSASSASSSAALFGAAAAAAAGGAGMVPASMAGALMAASGGDFTAWPQQFTLG